MITWHRPYAESHPLAMRRHDADGISPEAHAIISSHGLNMGAVLGWAGYYAAKEGVDFNRAPAQDFEAAPLGLNLVKAGIRPLAFDQFWNKFGKAARSHDYSAPDDIISRFLADGVIVDRSGRDMYDQWKRYAERLEGLNVALYRAAASAAHLHRFIANLAELDNYLSGRWRRKGDEQDRVPTTVGTTNRYLATEPVARITYDVRAVREWMQPVRYSPYPRKQDALYERFGDEKDGRFAGRGEVHIYTKCPIPAPIYIKIRLLPACNRGRQYVIDRYGGVGDVE